jgi:Kdo2-lipid IVA lauroyltransferase/acyltransferase
MTQTTDSQGTLADWATDRMLRGLIAAAQSLPYARRVALMGAVTRRAIGPLAGYRKRSLDNLALIWPDMGVSERRRIADAVADNFGRTLIENYSYREFGQRLVGTPVTGGGLAAVADAQAAGRPVIFVTGHFGNHEAPRHVLHGLGYRIGGIYRDMSNPYFNEHYVQTMADVSGPVFAKGRRGTMGFARHLRDGGMATILFDVRVKNAPEIPFLGRPARTSTSAADLALRFDAVVVPYFGIRNPDGLTFTIAVEEPIALTDPLTMTAEMTARLEGRIHAHPGQWFWVHRRWK